MVSVTVPWQAIPSTSIQVDLSWCCAGDGDVCVGEFERDECAPGTYCLISTNCLIIAVDVTLDADTAHPRLQVSEDGESVKDTGVIRKVPSKEKRFDSHTFLLAKEGYTSGMHYWEVDVGKKHNWNLGVAQENVARKETVALSPKNGFWVIGLADGQEYWAHSDPWIRLIVSGRPQKIGIFLDISSKKLSFISVHQKKVLYTFTSVTPIATAFGEVKRGDAQQ
uniref:B30.2/SPRY domain-containing protein n=1 Tax=Coturnix japonica TaxID=93934 RepID=A0A8C2SZF5_COTJA